LVKAVLSFLDLELCDDLLDERDEPCTPLFDVLLFIFMGVDVCTKLVDALPAVVVDDDDDDDNETAPGTCNDLALLNDSTLFTANVFAVDEDDDAVRAGEEAPAGFVFVGGLSLIFDLINDEDKEFEDVSFIDEIMFVRRVLD
jgi:hypothetical protein